MKLKNSEDGLINISIGTRDQVQIGYVMAGFYGEHPYRLLTFKSPNGDACEIAIPESCWESFQSIVASGKSAVLSPRLLNDREAQEVPDIPLVSIKHASFTLKRVIKRCLQYQEAATLRELALMTDNDILGLSHIGIVGLQEVHELLKPYKRNA
jgi:hypothetical protein